MKKIIADFKVKKAVDLGTQFVKNKHRMIGQDGAYSIPLKDGALWFFGDTLIGTRPSNKSLWYIDGVPVGGLDMTGKGTIDQMITNTGLILKDDSEDNGLKDFQYILDSNGNLKNLIPLRRDEDKDKIRIWCQHGIALGDWIYLSFIKVEMFEKPKSGLPVEFEIVGSGFAKGKVGEWEFVPQIDLPKLPNPVIEKINAVDNLLPVVGIIFAFDHHSQAQLTTRYPTLLPEPAEEAPEVEEIAMPKADFKDFALKYGNAFATIASMLLDAILDFADPAIIVVCEDGSWIEVARWYEW